MIVRGAKLRLEQWPMATPKLGAVGVMDGNDCIATITLEEFKRAAEQIAEFEKRADLLSSHRS